MKYNLGHAATLKWVPYENVDISDAIEILNDADVITPETLKLALASMKVDLE